MKGCILAISILKGPTIRYGSFWCRRRHLPTRGHWIPVGEDVRENWFLHPWRNTSMSKKSPPYAFVSVLSVCLTDPDTTNLGCVFFFSRSSSTRYLFTMVRPSIKVFFWVTNPLLSSLSSPLVFSIICFISLLMLASCLSLKALYALFINLIPVLTKPKSLACFAIKARSIAKISVSPWCLAPWTLYLICVVSTKPFLNSSTSRL